MPVSINTSGTTHHWDVSLVGILFPRMRFLVIHLVESKNVGVTYLTILILVDKVIVVEIESIRQAAIKTSHLNVI